MWRVFLFYAMWNLLWAQGESDLLEEEFFQELSGAKPALPDTQPQRAAQAPPDLPAADTLFNPPKPPPPLRLIDSPVASDLTLDPRVNARISTHRPFQVQIVRGKLQNFQGHPLLHGFDTWYLYIVKAEEVRINGRVLRSQGLPVYLAVVSPAPKLDELPTVLESPALMIKGLVDYGDTIVKHFKREKKRLQSVLDSLLQLPLPPDELQADAMEKLLERVHDSLVYADAYYELYREFKRSKSSGKTLVNFFLSFPFNRTLTYSIYSAPYALPRYVPPEASPAEPAPSQKRKRS